MNNIRSRRLRQIIMLIPFSIFLLLFTHLAGFLANGQFSDSGQELGGDITYDVSLADVDGDADLDAFVANRFGNRIWINQGGAQNGDAGIFANSGQSPGLLDSRGVALGDVDGNQTADAFVVNNGEREVWLNNGSGQFTLDQQLPSDNRDGQDVALGFLNGDQALDAIVVNHGPNEVWLNDGSGDFNQAQDDLGSARSKEVALGDLNGDGKLDAYVANGSTGAEEDVIWLNDGNGNFTLSNQTLDFSWNEGVALGDLDGDDDLDIFLATWFGTDSVWINQGGAQNGSEGNFVDSGQELSSNSSTDVSLLDVDDDQDLDAIVAKWLLPNEVWINNGQGQFSNSGQELDDAATYEVVAGDLDLDGDPDLFFGNNGTNHIWVMGGFRLPNAWFEVDARANPDDQLVYPWAQPGPAILPVVLGFPAPQGLDVRARIEANEMTVTETIAFDAGQLVKDLEVDNPGPTASNWMTITLATDASLLQLTSPDERVNPLSLIFVDTALGPADCVLCMADWVLKLAGFEPSFWMLHHFELAELRGSPTWQYYAGLGKGYTPELSTTILTNPALLWQSYEVLQLWTPAIGSYDEGNGAEVIMTGEMMADTEEYLQNLSDKAGPGLSRTIDRELQILDPDSMIGLNMNQIVNRISERVTSQAYLPVVMKAGAN